MILTRTNSATGCTENIAVLTSHDPAIEALARDLKRSTADVWESLKAGQSLERKSAAGVTLAYCRADTEADDADEHESDTTVSDAAGQHTNLRRPLNHAG